MMPTRLHPSVWHNVLGFVLHWEGGRVDDPDDRGGRTAFGIRQATYNSYRDGKRQRRRDVWSIDPSEVWDIYYTHYWSRCRGPELELHSPRFAFVLCDSFVNHGAFTTAKIVQERVTPGMVDGIWGPMTWGGVEDTLQRLGDRHTAAALLDWRKVKYQRIVAADPSQAKFWEGWMHRLASAGRVVDATINI